MSAEELEAFSRDLVQDVLATAEATDTTTPEAFTERMIEHLTDAGEIEDAVAGYHSARGIEVSGYAADPDGGRLTVFTTDFRQEPGTLTRTDLDTLVRRLRGFLLRCSQGYATEIDDGLPAHDMVRGVEKALTTATAVRLLVFTNSTSRLRSVPMEPLDGLADTVSVWDAERLRRMLTSGALQESIEVDFTQRFGRPLPCLTTPVTDQDYSVLLTIIPAAVLADLYAEYGARLLQLNVRSFLQGGTPVNRGIRDTLINHPERFLAYNNGISATASSVTLTRHEDGTSSIEAIRDLQIVNGGQTTASIHAVRRRDRVDLTNVFVQAKLTVVQPESLAEIVPSISRFSNTQNKVTTADFSSNSAYHVDIEKLSRATWAPSATGDGQETHWFYERARGQYADELARQGTPARQRAWTLSNPRRQKFTKTDLAKFENSWAGQPHTVSRGAEKNFYAYMADVDERGLTADATTFRHLVARAVLFRSTERIVTAQQFGGYRANIVAYTIARLVTATGGRIDLDGIWRRQALTPALEQAVAALSHPVKEALTTPPRGGNIGEWCKKPDAWARVEGIAWSVPPDLADELLTRAQQRDLARTTTSAAGATGPGTPAPTVPAGTWEAIYAWGRDQDRLDRQQLGLAHRLAAREARATPPGDLESLQAPQLLAAARDAGFTANETTAAQVGRAVGTGDDPDNRPGATAPGHA